MNSEYSANTKVGMNQVETSGFLRKKQEEITSIVHEFRSNQMVTKILIEKIGYEEGETVSVASVSDLRDKKSEQSIVTHHQFLDKLINELRNLQDIQISMNNHLMSVL